MQTHQLTFPQKTFFSPVSRAEIHVCIYKWLDHDVNDTIYANS